MKVFLKFTILCAWLLFVAALWQTRRASANSIAGRSSGLLSISRKMTDGKVAVQPPTDPQSMAWPTSELYLTIPTTGL